MAVIVTAAGSGERLGAGIPKAFVDLAGSTMLQRAVDAVLASGVVDRVVVAVPSEKVGTATELLAGRADVISGGSERPETVLKALSALSVARDSQPCDPEPCDSEPCESEPCDSQACDPKAGDPRYVLVHDAARPLTPPVVIRRVIDALRAGSRAVIPVLPVSDTIKAVDANGAVLGTPERSGLRAVQTPQGFETALLRQAYERATDFAVTDDASLVERAGIPVQTVAGDPLAFKITTPLDLRLARAVLET